MNGKLVCFTTSARLDKPCSRSVIEEAFSSCGWVGIWEETYQNGVVRCDHINYKDMLGAEVVVDLVPEQGTDDIRTLRMLARADGVLEHVIEKVVLEALGAGEPPEVTRAEVGFFRRDGSE